jgi:hypothetical protein
VSGGSLLVIAVVQLALTAAPGVAATLLGIRCGVRNVPVLIGIGLAGSGVTAMVAFWVYYAVPRAGGLWAYAVLLASIALTVWTWPEVSRHRALLRELTVPLGLWALASLFILFFGFLHGETEYPLVTALSRFAMQPSLFNNDHLIPLFFSDWMFAGSHGAPPDYYGWLLSDRPPLQIGYVLTQRVFGWDTTGTHYTALGVGLQQFWIVGMWALLVATRVSRRTISLVVVAALLSDVAIVNSFFVWPKLLAAAFVLAGLALVAAPGESPLRRRPLTIVLLGVLVALAFLSHGTAVFGLISLAVVVLWRGLPNWRWLCAGTATMLVLVLPWIAFQHFENPPGDRLAKWSLAGVAPIDKRGAAETIIDEYRRVGLGGALENKFQNFLTMAGGDAADRPVEGWEPFGDVITELGDMGSAVAHGRLAVAISKAREIRYWHLLWTLGILLLALPLIAVGRLKGRWRDTADWRFARFCLLVCGVGTLAWGLLMFGNEAGRAIVITACLALPLLAIAGIVAGLRATYPRLVGWFVGANAITVLILYVPVVAPAPNNSYSGFATIAAVVSLVGFVKLAFSGASDPASRGSDSLHAPVQDLGPKIVAD